ncbi:hypothetical protein OSB04_006090 [Centaurea solstitialis]|uniref:Uncharacterized protein n=1 Tax=Centaurea solstitialis TaxID=347529 RepID=A0AA38WQ47_9ASTR|nr:hypothetical protein OSB04_006090 [Centaurea solstitialis]
MTPEEVNYINRGDYQGRWNNNRNFIPRPPGFFAPNQQNQRPDGEPRVSIENRIVQFMDMQKKLNDEVGRVSQMLSERTPGELPTQTQVNLKVENVKPMLIPTDYQFKGLALVDSGAALNMMPVSYCRKMGVKKIIPTDYQYRGVNGYMTKPLGIAEGVPIRIGNFVYYTDFVIANLPQNTEIPIILGRSFLHTAQVNTDMRNQVTSLGYGENQIYFDPNGEPVTHLDEPYVDTSLAYKKSMNRPLLPHEREKKTKDYPNPIRQKEQTTNGSGPSKKEYRKKRGSSSDVPRNEPKKGSSSRPIQKRSASREATRAFSLFLHF